MSIVTRAKWGAEYPKGSGPIAGPVRGTSLHWEGPKIGAFHHDECAGKVRGIERFNAVTRGWSGIAYSAVVCLHGYVFEGRGVGVRTATNGTSSIGGNDRWYAVCYLGGETDVFTDAGERGFIEAVQWLRRGGNAGDAVNGHRDHDATACPGDLIYVWLNRADFDAPIDQEDDIMQLDAQTKKWFEDQFADVAQEAADKATRQLLQSPLKIGDGKTITLRRAIRAAGRTPAIVQGLRDDIAEFGEFEEPGADGDRA